MQRRDFLKTLLAAGAATATIPLAFAQRTLQPASEAPSAPAHLYLTMDDGYEHVDRVLDDSAAHGLPVAFFPTGQALLSHPRAWQRALEEGHDIGCHSFTHPAASRLSLDAFRAELTQFVKAAHRTLGQAGLDQLQYFRFPYGDVGGRRRAAFRDVVTQEFGWHVVGWDMALADTFPKGTAARRSPAEFGHHLQQWARPDSILLMHFVHPDYLTLPELKEVADKHGYRFMPLSAYPHPHRFGAIAS